MSECVWCSEPISGPHWLIKGVGWPMHVACVLEAERIGIVDAGKDADYVDADLPCADSRAT